MTNAKTLESVVSTFEQWRQRRSSRSSPIPKELRDQALELLDHYPKSKVLAALKINHTQLKQWQQAAPLTNTAFVVLPEVADQPSDPTSLQITLRHPLRGDLQITGQITPDQLFQVVQSFISAQGIRS